MWAAVTALVVRTFQNPLNMREARMPGFSQFCPKRNNIERVRPHPPYVSRFLCRLRVFYVVSHHVQKGSEAPEGYFHYQWKLKAAAAAILGSSGGMSLLEAFFWWCFLGTHGSSQRALHPGPV